MGLCMRETVLADYVASLLYEDGLKSFWNHLQKPPVVQIDSVLIHFIIFKIT